MTESRGGVRVYVPPAKRKQLMEAAAQEEAVDSSQKQRDTWQEERRVVHGTINFEFFDHQTIDS
jgi:hypothetical protein